MLRIKITRPSPTSLPSSSSSSSFRLFPLSPFSFSIKPSRRYQGNLPLIFDILTSSSVRILLGCIRIFPHLHPPLPPVGLVRSALDSIFDPALSFPGKVLSCSLLVYRCTLRSFISPAILPPVIHHHEFTCWPHQWLNVVAKSLPLSPEPASFA